MLFSCPKGTWLPRGGQLGQNYRPSRDTGPSTCPWGSLTPPRALYSVPECTVTTMATTFLGNPEKSWGGKYYGKLP